MEIIGERRIASSARKASRQFGPRSKLRDTFYSSFISESISKFRFSWTSGHHRSRFKTLILFFTPSIFFSCIPNTKNLSYGNPHASFIHIFFSLKWKKDERSIYDSLTKCMLSYFHQSKQSEYIK